jgi:hypothetical protein
MNGLQIDRLTLDVPAMSTPDARRLALLVAAGLAQASGFGGGSNIPSMQVAVEASLTGGLGILADRIVADALRQIQRTP